MEKHAEIATNVPNYTLEDRDELVHRIQDLQAFQDQWEPVLTEMVPALVSIVQLATSMMPPAMQGMIPPEVSAFVTVTERKHVA